MTKTSKRLLISFIVGLIFYFSVGFFVIRPVGVISDGSTIMYFRIGLNTSFITSVDGILLEKDQDVSLLSRAIVLAKVGKAVNDRKIVKLPYSETMYLISTGGKQFEK